MREIKLLSELIREELDDATKYAKLAVQYKDSERRIGDAFANLARAELDHSSILHEQAVTLIRAFQGTPPKAMQIVWDWEHERQMKQTQEIKILLDMYK